MLTMVAWTAAVLGVALLAGLVAVLVFLVEIRRFVAETSITLLVVNERASQLAGRVQRIQQSTCAAASSLAPQEIQS